MITQDNITIGQRIAAPKPPLFRRILKTVGTVTAISTSIAGATVAISPPVAAIAGIIAAVGAGITAVAALPVDFNKLNQQTAQ